MKSTPVIRRSILSIVFLIGIAAMSNALAQDNFWLHEGPILLENITIIDGMGRDAKPMRDVLIQDGRIARISVTTMMPKLPEGTRVIDGRGFTVLPGLMDTHTHIMDIDYTRSTKTETNLRSWMVGSYLVMHLISRSLQTILTVCSVT